jgi:hypothetical protein
MTRQALLDHVDGADTDLLRRVLTHAMQRLIEAEAAARTSAPSRMSAQRPGPRIAMAIEGGSWTPGRAGSS